MSFSALTRQRIGRAAIGLLVLAAAAFAQFKLANVPEPVNLETTGKFSPATIRLGQEELIIEGPLVNSPEGMLFSHDGSLNEIVDVSFERARLDQQTVEKFESLGLSPPSTPSKIDYRAEDSMRAHIGIEPCRTRVELRAPLKMPEEIHLFQLGDPGLNHYRQLEMRVTGAELTSHVVIESPSGAYLEPGCQKVLKVGDWNRSSSIDVTTIVAENSDLRFSFKPITPNSALWKDTEGFFTPFELGQSLPTDPQRFLVSAVSIKTLGDSSSPLTRLILSARRPIDGSLLTVNGLKIGSDQLQLIVSGTGFVKIDGEDVTVDLFKRVQKYPLLLTLLGTLNAALVAWVVRLIRKPPSTP